LLQKDTVSLIERLLKLGYDFSVETNGSINISCLPKDDLLLVSLDIKCPSSGHCEDMDYSNLKLVDKKDQVKFVVSDKKDFAFSIDIIKEYNLVARTNVFLCRNLVSMQPQLLNGFLRAS